MHLYIDIVFVMNNIKLLVMLIESSFQNVCKKNNVIAGNNQLKYILTKLVRLQCNKHHKVINRYKISLISIRLKCFFVYLMCRISIIYEYKLPQTCFFFWLLRNNSCLFYIWFVNNIFRWTRNHYIMIQFILFWLNVNFCQVFV